MEKNELIHLQNAIKKWHSKDDEHLQAIFSDSKKIIVEAPAGSGKTRILVSKVAYAIASGKLPQYKRVLVLTFGVSAAYKIKKDLAEKLPELYSVSNTSIAPNQLNNKVTVSNFHGFARRVLKKYGYLIDGKLNEVNNLESVSDAKMEDLGSLNINLSEMEMRWITDFSDKLSEGKLNFSSNYDLFLKYIFYIQKYFLPRGYITFNAFLILLLELFKNYPELLEFYKNLYPIIIVDEFQDTNILSWEVIQNLVDDKSNLWLLGDPLQRIYGFIGAIEGLMDIAQNKYSMEKIELHKNYRFKDNESLLRLDKCIRNCAKNSYSIQEDKARVDVFCFDSLEEENNYTLKLIKNFLEKRSNSKLAILSRSNSVSIKKFVEQLDALGLDYFYGLFTDEDKDYICFHNRVLNAFNEWYNSKININKKTLANFYCVVEKIFEKPSQVEKSLLILLKACFDNLVKEYKLLDKDDKISYIRDVLSNRSLKQCVEYIDSKVILSTIHGAKGLEWEYVLVRGLANWTFPSWLCGKCKNYKDVPNECRLNLNKVFSDKVFLKEYLEELSVFYVAITRAKKNLALTTNKERINSSNKIFNNCEISCFLRLPNIEINKKEKHN